MLRDGDATFVYVIASERAQRADVTLGNLADGWYVVESGLRGGEHVAVTGQARLRAGHEGAGRGVIRAWKGSTS